MKFYAFINGEQRGPYTIDQLAALEITPDTDVWTKGMDDWMPAGDVPELTDLLEHLEGRRHHAPEPEPRTYNTPRDNARDNGKRRGGCLMWSILTTIVVLAVLIITVPTRREHVDTVKDVAHEWIALTINQTTGGTSVLGEAAKWVGNSGADLIIDKMFAYDNYFVCSVGSFNLGTHKKRVSLGILGHVFTVDTDDLCDLLKENITPPQQAEETTDLAPDINDSEPLPIYPERTQPEDAPEGDKNASADKDDPTKPARDLIDTLATQAKREAVKAAKEWAKKKIDEM